MVTSQSNQRPLTARQSVSAPVILYVTHQVDVTAFHIARLREAGYNLQTVATAEEALRKLDQVKPDVVIVGHRLNLSDRIKIEEGARLARPKPRIVLLYENSIAQTEQADAVLNVNSEPQHLAQTIRYLLTGSD